MIYFIFLYAVSYGIVDLGLVLLGIITTKMQGVASYNEGIRAVFSFAYNSYSGVTHILLVYIVLFLLWKKFKKFDFKKLFKKEKLLKETTFWGIHYFLLNVYVAFIISRLFPSINLNRHDLKGLLASNIGLLIAAFIIPFFEELFFRGVMCDIFLNKFSPLGTIIGTGCIFALLHGKPGIIMIVTGSTFYFSYIYLKTNNLWSSIKVHVINNSIVSIFMFIGKGLMFIDRGIGESDNTASISLKAKVILLVIGLYLISLCLYNFKRMIKDSKQMKPREGEKKVSFFG